MVNIGLTNGDSPIRCQAITESKDDLLYIRPSGTNFGDIWTKIQASSFRKTQKRMYRKISDIRRIKFLNLNVSHFVLQLSLPNPLKPGVKQITQM